MRPELDLEHPLAPLLPSALRSPAGSRPRADGRPLFPWEDESLGLFRSLALTLRGALFHPARFFGEHRGGRGAGAPFVFGLAAGSSGLMLALFGSSLGSALSPDPSGWIGSGGGTAVGGTAGAAVLLLGAPLAALAWLGFQTLWCHLWLLLFGAGSRGIQATTRALGYSMSAALFLVLPEIGPTVAAVWGMTILIAGLARLHGRSPLRVGAALFVPPLAAFFLLALAGGGFG